MAVISSPLSKSLRGGLVQVQSGSVFGRGGDIGSSSLSRIDIERNTELMQNNNSMLNSVSSNLYLISSEIKNIRNGIASIANAVSSDTRLDERSAYADLKYNKILSERKIRTEGEQTIENKIQQALLAPVKAVSKTIAKTFGSIGDAIKQLLFGWITLQLVDAFKAYSEGNIEKLKEIGSGILKVFKILVGATGIFYIIKSGITSVIKSCFKLTSAIAGFVISGLFLKPFKMLTEAITNSWSKIPRITPPPVPGRGGKPPRSGIPGIPGIIGGIINGFSGVLNFMNGENVDAALNALTFIPGGGIFFKGVRVLSASAVIIDEILESLGKNFTGADPKLLEKKRKELEDLKRTIKTSDKTSTNFEQITPQTSLMGENNKENGDKKGVKANSVTGITIPNIDGVSVSDNMSNNTPTSNVTPQIPKTLNSNYFSIGSGSVISVMPNISESSSDPATISPISSQNMNVKMESLGPESKPKTTVIASIPNSSSGQSQSGNQTTSTDVPNIKSSNPDNFYSLYSQITYNVIM